MPPLTAYGRNPHEGVDPNINPLGWGDYAWPGGVPQRLLTTSRWSIPGITSGAITMRSELVPLVLLCMRIAYEKFGYVIWGYPNPGNDPTWGPWTYQNRPIAGTKRASNHSKARAWDINAPRNPMSLRFQSDLPPGFVAVMESLGWFWGGRYKGQQYDPMHFEYIGSVSSVAQAIAKAKAILGPEDDVTEDQLTAAILKVLRSPEGRLALGIGTWGYRNPANDPKTTPDAWGQLSQINANTRPKG